jgi:hypothetical protein
MSNSELFVYLANQRSPPDQAALERVDFPNPSIEIFQMSAITANTIEHVATISEVLIRNPNDVVGSAHGNTVPFQTKVLVVSDATSCSAESLFICGAERLHAATICSVS